MARPAGLMLKRKNNDHKHSRIHDEWQAGKKLGRPAQQFNAETNTWGKVSEPRKVTI
jgi:hypothetical protein